MYVDDIIVTGDAMIEIDGLKDILDQKFVMKNLGDLKYILGIEVKHNLEGMRIT